jgi:hypothetical protein
MTKPVIIELTITYDDGVPAAVPASPWHQFAAAYAAARSRRSPAPVRPPAPTRPSSVWPWFAAAWLLH